MDRAIATIPKVREYETHRAHGCRERGFHILPNGSVLLKALHWLRARQSRVLEFAAIRFSQVSSLPSASILKHRSDASQPTQSRTTYPQFGMSDLNQAAIHDPVPT